MAKGAAYTPMVDTIEQRPNFTGMKKKTEVNPSIYKENSCGRRRETFTITQKWIVLWAVHIYIYKIYTLINCRNVVKYVHIFDRIILTLVEYYAERPIL